MSNVKAIKQELEVECDIDLDLEVQAIELNSQPNDKGRTLGCWGPSPDDSWNQC